ncbi:hypothetical protein [Dokdonia sp.]|uniref:hypothetical protein n=1 Tax=Dokdonia sp. TaxID=2024995 RepID=UPI0032637E71
MKKMILFALVATMGLFVQNVHAQDETIEEKIEVLEARKQEIVELEKEALREEVKAIMKELEEKKITEIEANRLKKEAAEKRALNIENRVAILDNQIALLKRNKTDEDILRDDNSIFRVVINKRKNKARTVNHNRRTRSDFVFAVGFNNAIIDGQGLDDSPYRVAGSRFAELGWAWTTRVFKNDPWLRIKYGFSFQFNGLKPTGNRYFVEENGQTVLQEFDEDLDKSKFRIDNLVIPFHFEFGPYKKHVKDDSSWYSTHNKLKIGLGGYAGLNIGTLQKLKFSRDGNKVKEKERGDFEVNDFVYGLSGYIGWDNIGIYAKYDLNTIFENSPVDQRNVSLGLRFDLD